MPALTLAASERGLGFSITRTPVGTCETEPRQVRDHHDLVHLWCEDGQRDLELCGMPMGDDHRRHVHVLRASR